MEVEKFNFYAKVGTQPNEITVDVKTAEDIWNDRLKAGDKIQFQVPNRFGSTMCNGIATKTDPILFIDLM
jgi:hypothetical protein